MDNALAVTVLVIIAIAAANAPFLTERVLFVRRLARGVKPFIVRLAEVIVMYLLVGGLARLLEARGGSIYPQGWEFYAITLCLFLVFAYPGYVYRYLWRRRPESPATDELHDEAV